MLEPKSESGRAGGPRDVCTRRELKCENPCLSVSTRRARARPPCQRPSRHVAAGPWLNRHFVQKQDTFCPERHNPSSVFISTETVFINTAFVFANTVILFVITETVFASKGFVFANRTFVWINRVAVFASSIVVFAFTMIVFGNTGIVSRITKALFASETSCLQSGRLCRQSNRSRPPSNEISCIMISAGRGTPFSGFHSFKPAVGLVLVACPSILYRAFFL